MHASQQCDNQFIMLCFFGSIRRKIVIDGGKNPSHPFRQFIFGLLVWQRLMKLLAYKVSQTIYKYSSLDSHPNC